MNSSWAISSWNSASAATSASPRSPPTSIARWKWCATPASSPAASASTSAWQLRRKCGSTHRCIDSTDLQVFSQELRLASTGEGPFQWLVGAFYQQSDREYGQDLPTPGYDAILLRRTPPGRDSAYYNAPPDTPYFSDLNYDFSQFALFGEATYRFTPAMGADRGSALLRLQRRPHADLRRGLCRPGLHRRAGLDGFGRFLAARHPRLQPRRRRADQRAGVAWLPARRHQRSAQRRAVFAPGPRGVQRTSHLG